MYVFSVMSPRNKIHFPSSSSQQATLQWRDLKTCNRFLRTRLLLQSGWLTGVKIFPLSPSGERLQIRAEQCGCCSSGPAEFLTLCRCLYVVSFLIGNSLMVEITFGTLQSNVMLLIGGIADFVWTVPFVAAQRGRALCAINSQREVHTKKYI